MALYMPTNVSPSTMGAWGDGTVDLNNGLNISWQVNGNSAMQAFQIRIYENDSLSTKVYDTGKRTDNCPFYGRNANGNVVRFAYSIGAAALQSAGMHNGKDYKLVITQWWSDAESVTQQSASVFRCRKTAELTIDAFANPVTSKSATWTATYQYASPVWVRWMLRRAGADEMLLDTGALFTAQMELTYDELFNGVEYDIRCQVESTDGKIADTGWKSFSVSYETQKYSGTATAVVGKEKSGVFIQWPAAVEIQGKAEGTYTIENGVLTLPRDSKVIWDGIGGASNGLGFKGDWGIQWRGSIKDWNWIPFVVTGKNGLGASVTNTLAFPENLKQYARREGATVVYTANIIGHDVESTIITVYYKDDQGKNQAAGTSWRTGQPNPAQYKNVEVVETVQLTGAQTCSVLWIKKGAIQEGETPNFDSSTYMLADFINGLSGGSVQLAAGITGWEIYRETTDTGEFRKIGQTAADQLSIWDCSAVSQGTYTYYIFGVGNGTFALTPMTTNPIMVCLWDWSILSCTETSDGTYHVEKLYRFSLNVNSGAIPNNNSPGILDNFTPYPTVQLSTVNYRSGTLSGYIGYVGGGAAYMEKDDLRMELYALSTTGNTLFLKNRKGDLIQIRIAGEVSVSTLDASQQQAQTASIPWVEIGSTEGKRIVITEDDDFYSEPANGGVIQNGTLQILKTADSSFNTQNVFPDSGFIGMRQVRINGMAYTETENSKGGISVYIGKEAAQ